MQEYTPCLERYFEYNAYPSAPDRLLLARKSMMTPRQIEVWVNLVLFYHILSCSTWGLIVSESPKPCQKGWKIVEKIGA
jgi:Homeodomain